MLFQLSLCWHPSGSKCLSLLHLTYSCFYILALKEGLDELLFQLSLHSSFSKFSKIWWKFSFFRGWLWSLHSLPFLVLRLATRWSFKIGHNIYLKPYLTLLFIDSNRWIYMNHWSILEKIQFYRLITKDSHFIPLTTEWRDVLEWVYSWSWWKHKVLRSNWKEQKLTFYR